MGTASPISMCPRAFSTLGRLKRLNRDILEGARSTFGSGASLAVARVFSVGCVTSSERLTLDRFRRHLEGPNVSLESLRLPEFGVAMTLQSGLGRQCIEEHGQAVVGKVKEADCRLMRFPYSRGCV